MSLVDILHIITPTACRRMLAADRYGSGADHDFAEDLLAFFCLDFSTNGISSFFSARMRRTLTMNGMKLCFRHVFSRCIKDATGNQPCPLA